MKKEQILDHEMREQVREYQCKSLPEEDIYPDLTNDLAMDLRVIKDRSELQHTCYIEVCSEKKKEKACWNQGALYFTTDGFEYLEPMIRDVYLDYSQYSFQSLSCDEWRKIIKKMRDLSHALRSAEHKDDLGAYAQELFFYSRLNPFDIAFAFTREKLKAFIDDVIDALEAELEENENIYILGL